MKIAKPEGDISAQAARRAAPVIFWVTIAAILVALPWRIVSFGFLPPDDALRHAAKAVSGKTWQEILVMRPDITIDHNPGWHWILTQIHHATGWEPRALVVFSILSMFLVFAASPLPWFRRPEAWLASVTAMMVVFPYFAARAFIGRPLFITMASTLMILSLWTEKRDRPPKLKLAITIVLVALSTWIHGSWYLFLLISAAFFLARRWRECALITFCWCTGTVTGALFTGHPWTFLKQSAEIPFLALGVPAPVNSLVGEFQPFHDGWPALILVAVILVWRKFTSRPLALIWRDPVFWLALLGWALGFRVFRFWLDWGIPALALWTARQIEEMLMADLPDASPRRAGFIAITAIVLFLSVATDREARWSQYGKISALDARRPEDAEWLPDPGGLIYSVNLSVFYQTFFTNPHGNWKYVLGFEPSFMRPENLAVYQELWRTLNAIKACAPWVQRMKPADRLVLLGGPQIRPAIPQLEWHYAAENTWVGRLPRNPAALSGGGKEKAPPPANPKSTR